MIFSSNLQGNAELTSSLLPAARAATATGTGISMKNGDKTDVVFTLGAWTDGSHTFEIQEAPSTSTGAAGSFTAVAVADLYDKDGVLDSSGHLVVTAAPGASKVVVITYVGGADWLLIKQTVSGATTGMVAGAMVVVHLLRSVGNTPLSSNGKF